MESTSGCFQGKASNQPFSIINNLLAQHPDYYSTKTNGINSEVELRIPINLGIPSYSLNLNFFNYSNTGYSYCSYNEL